MKFLGWQATGSQRSNKRAGAWDGLDPESRFDSLANHPFTRVTNAWTAGIGDQSNAFAALQSIQQLLAATSFIELKITEQGLGDSEILQQLARSSSVFCRD